MTKEQEEAIEILERFKNNEMQRDKLERDERCGGWKIGDIYKHLELNIAIETVLSMLKEKDELIIEQLKENVKLQNELNEENKRCMILANNNKFKEQVINEMTKVMIDSSICDYFIKPECEHYAGENKLTCDTCIKQYFERKVKK